ncbi:17626_t:CDS:2 [Dentiscutata erythropus]|uniref:17626_t:CDS:1 n=1 Tax=Dentiscutata erythropus TaxID=1348616 RepID=A0A9N8ZP23_9GLOM|nr:17626_t:CDS:2 [Dentiscutata erythropus]
MKTFSIIFISFIFFSTLVRAQSETAANPATAASPATSTSAPDKISQCLQNQGCSYSDINCVAWCAGVPNPSPQDVNATNDCIASCPNTTNAGYQSCVSGCINSHYNQPTVYGTSSGAPPTQTGTYVAVFVQLVIWATLLLFSEFIRRRHVLPSPNIRFETGIAPPDFATADQMDNRYAKATNAARDSLLMLIIATILTQSGYGATAASVILSWIFLAISTFWVLSILFFDHMWLPLILEAMAFPFILAILALAFRPTEKGNPLPLNPRAKFIEFGHWLQ